MTPTYAVNVNARKLTYMQRVVGDVITFLWALIYGLQEKNWKSEVVFAVCRLPLTSYLTCLIFYSGFV